MVNTSQLPLELYRDIVNDPCLTKPDLLNLCLTSRDMLAETLPFLYRQIDFSDPKTNELAIRTLSTITQWCGLVQVLLIHVTLESNKWIQEHEEAFANTLNAMKRLDRLFIIDRRDQLGVERLTWTPRLSLPTTLQCLHFSGLKPASPLRRQFLQLYNPLRHYVVYGFALCEDIGSVEHLRCEGIRACGWTQLPHLKSLEIPYPDDTSLQLLVDFAPNFETLVFTGSLVCNWSSWIDYIPQLKRIKAIGPIRLFMITEAFMKAFSSLDVEILVFSLTQDYFGQFDDTIATRIMCSASKLRRISVFSSTSCNSATLLSTWERESPNAPITFMSSEIYDTRSIQRSIRILMELPDPDLLTSLELMTL